MEMKINDNDFLVLYYKQVERIVITVHIKKRIRERISFSLSFLYLISIIKLVTRTETGILFSLSNILPIKVKVNKYNISYTI